MNMHPQNVLLHETKSYGIFQNTKLAYVQEERLTEEGMGKGGPLPPETPALPADTRKFLDFAETHRTVLNQILRQSTTHLADGPFAVLVGFDTIF
jgi:hypothetical protein